MKKKKSIGYPRDFIYLDALDATYIFNLMVKELRNVTTSYHIIGLRIKLLLNDRRKGFRTNKKVLKKKWTGRQLWGGGGGGGFAKHGRSPIFSLIYFYLHFFPSLYVFFLLF